jgi:putative oxidoreductase
MDRERLESLAYAVVRVVVGTFMALHGIEKLFGVFGNRVDVGSQLWIGGIFELVGGAFVAAGYYTRVAAFVVSGQMAVAYFQFHWKLQFADWQFLPVVNSGELSVVYCFVFLMIWARGAGEHSLDRRAGRA